MAKKLYEEIQPLLCRLSRERLVDICIATKAADYETIQAKSVCRHLNILNNVLEDSLDDESYSLSLLNSVKDACLKTLPLQVRDPRAMKLKVLREELVPYQQWIQRGEGIKG